MGLSDLRRWHWMVIGVLLGLLIGYSLNAIGTDALITGARAAKTSQTSFETELVQEPLQGADGDLKPFITHLIVYPDGPINLLKFQRLVNLEPGNRNSKRWEYQTWFYEARKPYSPLLQWQMRTDVRVKPDFPPDSSLTGHPSYVTNEAWRDADGVGKMYRDPGDGVTIYPSMAKGNYDMVIRLDDAKQAANLAMKFNGHVLPPLVVDPTDGRYFHTTIPVGDFDAQNARDLWLARKDAETPVHISQIHIYNPTYTVRDYLDAIQAEHPQMPHYTFAWWLEPKAQMWLAVGIGFVVIGVIWPTVLSLLVGAGFGPPPREKGVSLRNLKATPAPSAAGVAAPTEEDLAAMQQMEEDLLKELESESGGRPATTVSTGPAPIKTLNAKAVEPPLAAPKKEEGPKSFAGEFYPVARKSGSEEKKE